MLCPEGNGRLNELGEFRVSAGGYLNYLFYKSIQFKTFINLKFFLFYVFFFSFAFGLFLLFFFANLRC